uniref:Uncharacterized protein n=1 Tax=Microrhizoidea pickettheapsiorum TaxID=2604950 RepID=A0A5B9RJT9_9CHLO|nr:hypothetical protein [Microrhizoidea pickettheapsiorum]QEG77710.1 hypothetical protein [Microrhizoidea pickettheapsiorum]
MSVASRDKSPLASLENYVQTVRILVRSSRRGIYERSELVLSSMSEADRDNSVPVPSRFARELRTSGRRDKSLNSMYVVLERSERGLIGTEFYHSRQAHLGERSE